MESKATTMTTKPKQDLKFYIERAVRDLKTLIIYFNVTRPQYELQFKVNGKFSIDKMMDVQRILKAGWRACPYKNYNQLSAAYNYTFGIPVELIRAVVGEYVDDNGRHHRISSSRIVKHLQTIGFIKGVVGNGTRVVKDRDTGKFHSICRWRKKYPIANVKYWMTMLNDPRYSDINTIPNASSRVKRIVMRWHKKNCCHKVETATESRGRKLVQYVEQVMTNLGQEKTRRAEMKELSKMRDYDIERLCDLTKRYWEDARKNGRSRSERQSSIDLALRTAFPDLSGDLRVMFASVLPSVWDERRS